MTESSSGITAVPVVCGIIEQGDLFLAALRGPTQSNAGLWEFPGGKVRNGETSEAALKRELREELAIEVSLTSSLASHIYTYPSITIDLIPFICTLIHGEPHSHEHAMVRWLGPIEAQSLPWAPADSMVLREYRSLKNLS